VLKLREAGRSQVASLWLRNGEWSDPYVRGEGIRPRTTAEITLQYLALGFTHILPYGLDHILFVLGLFLLSARLRPLLIQVTAFTVAHSITLALTIYGVFALPSSVVEPLIAASIVYVGIENIFTSKLQAWRPFVVFGFGLLHGMGFAGVLSEIGLPRSESLTALVAFNVGVELGQLAVIALAFLAAGLWGRDAGWYRGRVVMPASLAIAAAGLYWTVERLGG
jgi:hydrogenase/urease accessory protein HupE